MGSDGLFPHVRVRQSGGAETRIPAVRRATFQLKGDDEVMDVIEIYRNQNGGITVSAGNGYLLQNGGGSNSIDFYVVGRDTLRRVELEAQ